MLNIFKKNPKVDNQKRVIFDKKNILVIGGAGFIGSNLIEYLLEKNKVICIDNFVTGKFENIEILTQFPDFAFIKHDMSEKIDLESMSELDKFRIQFQGIQDVIYLACPTSYKDLSKFSVETIDANSIALKNALDLAVKYKAKFLFASSSAIYGNAEDVTEPIIESYYGKTDHLEPRAPYNEGKRFAEMMVKTYHEKFNLDISIARIFSTYGPKMILGDGRMIPDFINNAMENRDIVINGDENSVSSFCYVDDLIDGLLKLIDSPVFEPINLGHPDEINIKHVAETIIQIMGSNSKIVFQDDFENFQRKLFPNINKAKETLSWMPMTPLVNGLKTTIEHFQREKVKLSPFNNK
ncbi:MAG TPA: NAD-dependent epimerase/dehydratase family protein [bacterium]|jgi:UDP-glucuronate decarboxylase|nr:NAD-dependent epimerase/dehydratase family protein [bacterium]HOG38022.1 NAD-dependent epimerase/dehydratase family protein [bacterium]